MTAPPSPQAPRPLGALARAEWRWWLGGAIAAALLASVLMSGRAAGLLPNLAYPYDYARDTLSHSWLAQRLLEGWIFDNPRSGYPFGSRFLDYPGSDAGNLLILKALGALGGSYFAALNLYFLLGFAVTFAVAYCVLRALGLGRPSAIAAAALFDFLPFHFLRLEHLFLTWYGVAPLYFYLALRIFHDADPPPRPWRRALACVALACFGVYYALFGLIVVACAALASARLGALRQAAWVAAFVCAGVLANIAPTLWYQHAHGANLEVAQRNPLEAEAYGFKLAQLLLPRPGHRVPALAEATRRYTATFPLVNENASSGLGAVGAAGLLLLFGAGAASLSGRRVAPRVGALALITLVLFLFGTIGGLGSLFAQTISASIRGWNRISVFIAFGTLLATFLLLENRLGRRPLALGLCALLLLGFGLADQTVPACGACNAQTKTAFELDRDLVRAIERDLPPGSALYQLPYMAFPEVPPLHGLHAYELTAGFLHSRTLRWSYGGTKGRAGDLFYRNLAQEPLAKQIEVARRLGFAALTVDRRGYADHGDATVAALTALLGTAPALARADAQVLMFRLGPGAPIAPDTLSEAQIMRQAGYAADRWGPRYAAGATDGIDFTRPGFPLFVTDVDGLSGPETWGRWSDANVAPAVRIDLDAPLPSRFVLALSGHAFGPNNEGLLTVRLGDQTLRLPMSGAPFEIRQPVELGAQQVRRIELAPPRPVSPSELGQGDDRRKLGIRLLRLRIDPPQ